MYINTIDDSQNFHTSNTSLQLMNTDICKALEGQVTTRLSSCIFSDNCIPILNILLCRSIKGS